MESNRSNFVIFRRWLYTSLRADVFLIVEWKPSSVFNWLRSIVEILAPCPDVINFFITLHEVWHEWSYFGSLKRDASLPNFLPCSSVGLYLFSKYCNLMAVTVVSRMIYNAIWASTQNIYFNAATPFERTTTLFVIYEDVIDSHGLHFFHLTVS